MLNIYCFSYVRTIILFLIIPSECSFPTNMLTTEQVAWIVSNFPNLDGFALKAKRDCDFYDASMNKVLGTLIVGKRKPLIIIKGNEKRIERYVEDFELLKQKYKGIPYKQAFKD